MIIERFPNDWTQIPGTVFFYKVEDKTCRVRDIAGKKQQTLDCTNWDHFVKEFKELKNELKQVSQSLTINN